MPCGNKMVRTYQRTRKGLTATIYSGQRGRNKKHFGKTPSYNLEQLREWIYSQPNFEELYLKWVQSGHEKMLIPSCDRKDDYKEYSLDNIRLTSWQENYDRFGRDQKNGINNKTNKAVIQMSLSGEFIKEYYSQNQAERETKALQSHISSTCLGARPTAGGFMWKFKEQ